MKWKTKEEREAKAFFNSHNSALLHGNEWPKAIGTALFIAIISGIILAFLNRYVSLLSGILMIVVGGIIGEMTSASINKKGKQVAIISAIMSVVSYFVFFVASYVIATSAFNITIVLFAVRSMLANLMNLICIAAGAYFAYRQAY